MEMSPGEEETVPEILFWKTTPLVTLYGKVEILSMVMLLSPITAITCLGLPIRMGMNTSALVFLIIMAQTLWI